MIKSMTGYGKAEAATEHKKITVEIRSLNSKQLDLTVKLPSAYRQCEYEIRQTVGGRLQRGKIDVFVSYETVGRATGVTIDRDVFAHYAGQLRELAEASGLGWGSAAADAAAMTAILRLPDTVQNNSEAVSDEALDRIDEFRAQEGATLIADLLRRIDRIEQIKNEIEPYEKARTETIKARIREHVESLGIPYDAGRLEQEMIYYIEKLDITEEKVRLQNHCRYFREVAHAEQGAGRKLGFIAQELGREINTLGSKSNEATMQKMVVEMKDELEKIKEQVLNIL